MTKNTAVLEHEADAPQGAGDALRSATANVASRVPEAVSATHDALDQASEHLAGTSNENVVLGAVFSVGIWLGLFVAGAPRILTLAAAIPALVLGATLVGRRRAVTPKGS